VAGEKIQTLLLGNKGALALNLADRIWYQMREATLGHTATIPRFIEESYGKDAIQQA